MRSRLLLVVLFATVCNLLTSVPVGSQSTADKIAELKRRLAAAEAAEGDRLAKIRASDERLAELNAIVDQIGKRLEEARRRLGAAQFDLDQATAQYLAKLGQVERADEAFGALQRRISDRVLRMYKDGNIQAVEIFLSARSWGEFDSGRSYLNSVSRQDREAARQLAEARNVLESERALLEETKTELQATRNRIDFETSEIAALFADNQTARDAVAAEQEAHRQILASILADKNEAQRLLDELEGTSRSATGDIFSRGSRGNPGIVPGALVWPCDGPITSGFGTRIHPISGTARFHSGIDIAAPTGTPIRAAASGRVIHAGSYGGYGITTVIDHGNGLATLYAHQSRLDVRFGDQVAQSQTIGGVGSTGYSTGPHLHFEVRINGEARDPMLWFPGR